MTTEDRPFPPPPDEAALDAARAALARQDPAGAEPLLAAFLAAHPDHIDALALLASAQDWLGRVPECIATLERLVTLAPARIDAPKYRLLAKLEVHAGARAAARATLAQGLAVHPGALELHVMRATLAEPPDDVCAELEEVLAKAAGNPRATLDILNTIAVTRARRARSRKGLPGDGVSWPDTGTWPDPEGLIRYREAISAQNQVKTRLDLLLDAACVAIGDGKWGRADEFLEIVRARAGGTLADYTAFGDAFHRGLDAFDHDAIVRLLPPVSPVLSPAPRTPETMLLASDPVYFRKFTLPFLAAAEGLALPLDVQVHIMGGDAAAWRGIAAELGGFRHLNVGFSAEDPGEAGEGAGRALYCHAIRFVRLYLEAARTRRRLWVFDVDAAIQRDPRALFARLDDFDVALRTDPCLLAPPARVAGNLVGIAPTPAGLEFARRVAAYIMYWKERGTWAWGIDQIGLFSTLAYVNRAPLTETGGTPRIYYQGAGDASNAEDNRAVFYFPTGVKKHFAAQA